MSLCGAGSGVRGAGGAVEHGRVGDLPRKMERPIAAIVEKEMIERPRRA